MEINFTYNNHDEARSLSEVVQDKFDSLHKFIGADQSVTCDVEYDKVAANQKGSVFKVAVNLQIDGTLYRADAVEESFEAAVDEVRAELDKRLRRAKSRKDSLHKKAGRAIKQLFSR